MDTVTYPDPGVIRHLGDRFVPVKLEGAAHPELLKRYNSIWTPSLICTDANDRVHSKTYGFLPPDEFRGELLMMEGKFHMGHEAWDQAEGCFTEVVDRWKNTHWVPEALYWKGVATYKGGNERGLTENWRRLKAEHPDSTWHIRSSFIFRDLGKK